MTEEEAYKYLKDAEQDYEECSKRIKVLLNLGLKDVVKMVVRETPWMMEIGRKKHEETREQDEQKEKEKEMIKQAKIQRTIEHNRRTELNKKKRIYEKMSRVEKAIFHLEGHQIEDLKGETK